VIRVSIEDLEIRVISLLEIVREIEK